MIEIHGIADFSEPVPAQAARCRSALRRMLLLERFATSRGQYQKSLLPPTVAREVKAWQDCGKEMALLCAQLIHGAPATMAKILENAPALPADASGYADGTPFQKVASIVTFDIVQVPGR
jgi:hypothetical protein